MRKQSFCYRSLLIVTSPAVFQVSTTTDGLDADLWKDGLFKSKVTRYLCFTRVFSKENVSKSNSAIRKMSKISHLIQFNNHLKKSSSLMFFFFFSPEPFRQRACGHETDRHKRYTACRFHSNPGDS